MDTIPLPLTRCMSLAAWLLVLGCGALVLASRTAWPWRLGCATLVLAVGGLLWRRYLRRRPHALHLAEGGRLSCTLADGRELPVNRIEIGVLGPGLVSARLHASDGRRLDLFVPGRSLTPAAHWRLRRALVAFRPADEDGQTAARGGGPSVR